MIREQLDHPIHTLPGVGPKTAEKLAAQGILSVGDVLNTTPRTYEDRRFLVPLAAAAQSLPPAPPVPVVTVVEIIDHVFFGPKGHLKIIIRDSSTTAALVCFGRNFLAQSLPIGRLFLVAGNFSVRYHEIQTSAFETEPLPAPLVHEWTQLIHGESRARPVDGPGKQIPRTRQFGMLLPRYPNLAGLGEQKIRTMVHKALDLYGKNLEDPLPTEVLKQHHLPPYNHALTNLHQGQNSQEIQQAHKRMVYQELFLLQLNLAYQAYQRRTVKGSPKPPVQETTGPDYTRQVLNSLPYTLTNDQKTVLEELNREVAGPVPMARLIQGDVGSGKTVVALLACARMAELGRQSVLMAPTELLARQHANTAHAMLAPAGLTVAFLSGSLNGKARTMLLQELAAGNIHLLVGTHAVFTRDVEFQNLGLSIVDEQHRFGVNQRTALVKKGEGVHLLLMSATPIPRTLAMTVYGDLLISTISEKPAGRKPVETHLARMGNEQKVYDFVRRQLEQGWQAYFVYPRIDDQDNSEPVGDAPAEKSPIKSAEAMAELLSSQVYRDYRVGLIHGQMKDEEKIATMAAFSQGEIRVLVSTTVVEVGVDVANATCMVIEHAERFGLAALHQLRGRVGRSALQSYCFLVYAEPLTEIAVQRLKILKESNDGFLLAEKDLELRGPGDIQGIQQSGFLKFTFADLSRDMGLMNLARKDAFALMDKDPGLADHHWLKWLVS